MKKLFGIAELILLCGENISYAGAVNGSGELKYPIDISKNRIGYKQLTNKPKNSFT